MQLEPKSRPKNKVGNNETFGVQICLFRTVWFHSKYMKSAKTISIKHFLFRIATSPVVRLMNCTIKLPNVEIEGEVGSVKSI